MAKKKTAFVLSGGGLRGCFQVGALKYLMEEKGIKPDIVCGISTGSLQAVGVALGIDLEQFWTENINKTSDIYSCSLKACTVINIIAMYLCSLALCMGVCHLVFPTFIGYCIAATLSFLLFGAALICFYLPNMRYKSIFKLKGLRKILKKYLTAHALDDTDIKLFVGSVDLKSSIITYHTNNHINVDTVQASCTIPLVFQPVGLSGMPSVDGGVRDIAPMRIAVDHGATDIYLVICDPLEPHPYTGKIKSILAVGERTLGIICHEIILNDIKAALRRNQLVGPGKYKKVNLYVIYPDEAFLEMYGNVVEVNPEKIKKGIKSGKERAKAILDNEPITYEEIEAIIEMTRRIV
jgi:NTE family protein